MNAILDSNIQFFRYDAWVVAQVWCVWAISLAVGLPVFLASLSGDAPRAWRLRIATCVITWLSLSQLGFQFQDTPGAAPALWLLIPAGVLSALILKIRTDSLAWFLCFLSALTLVEAFTSLRIVRTARQELRLSDWPIRPLEVPAGAPRPNIFHFIFDELSLRVLLDERGAIDPAIAPALASLAREASFYPNAISHYPSTFYSIGSTLRSELLLPAKSGTPHRSFKNAVQGRSLLRYLRQRDYRVEIYGQHIPYHELIGPLAHRITTSHDLDPHVSQWELAHAYLARHLPGGLADELTRVLGAPAAVSQNKLPHYGAKMLELATQRVPQLPSQGSYVLLHTILPHFLFMFKADGSRRIRSRPPTEADYIAQIQFTDRLLGRYLDALRRQNLYDSSLIVLQADHGVRYPFAELWPDTPPELERVSTALIFMVPETIDTLARIPLVIKQPGQREARIDLRPASLLDVYPTIAATLGDKVSGLRGLPLGLPRGQRASPLQQRMRSAQPFISSGRDGRKLYLWDRYEVHASDPASGDWRALVPAEFEAVYQPRDFSQPEAPSDFVELPAPPSWALVCAALCGLAALRGRAPRSRTISSPELNAR